MEQREASCTARHSPASPNAAIGKRITKRKQMQQIKRGAYQLQQMSPRLGPATLRTVVGAFDRYSTGRTLLTFPG